MFIVYAAVLIIIVLLLIAWPLFRNSRRQPLSQADAATGDAAADLETEKENILASIRDLEADIQGGKLSPADYKRLRDMEEHRLAEILDRIDSIEAAEDETPERRKGLANDNEPSARFRAMNIAVLTILILLIAGGASAVYYYHSVKIQEQNLEAMMENPGAVSMEGTPGPVEMVARLERKLRQNPNDLDGQIMAGRSYMTIQRPEEARKAWSKVIELDPNNIEAYYSMGYLLIQSAAPGNPDSYNKSIEYLDHALLLSPGLPAALYYKGLALAHLKQYDEAVKNWEGAIQNLPPGSEDSEFVKDALRKLKSGNL
ncbi:MAG: tetratricopeptide repeat protein [Nitrospirae bacterium]|nr:tetratricopeptide repeat protein [Nitrospirota bacterium]